jgi:hypothetical protein
MTLTSSDPNWNSHDGAMTNHFEGEGKNEEGNVKYTPLNHPLDEEVSDSQSNLKNTEKELGKKMELS